MRGLLYKELLALRKERILLAFCPLAIIVSMISVDDPMMNIFVFMLAGFLPLTLFTSDEKSRWEQYLQTLPVTRAQIVNAKYGVGLFLIGGFTLLGCLVQTLMAIAANVFTAKEIVSLFLFFISVGCLMMAMFMPFIFGLGMEKGIHAYLIMMLLAAVPIGLFFGFHGMDMSPGQIVPLSISSVLFVIAVGAFVGSRKLSIRLYETREF